MNEYQLCYRNQYGEMFMEKFVSDNIRSVVLDNVNRYPECELVSVTFMRGDELRKVS